MKTTLPLTLATVFLPTLAHAHPGHGAEGFTSGLLHPLLGWDHLLAMLAVGLWAAQLGGRARWQVPAIFVGAMTLGGALGLAGLALAIAEMGILLSVLMLGVLVAAAVRLPRVASAGLIGAFAVCHGLAHGAEMPAAASAWSYGLGFAATTATLHLGGLLLGLALAQAARSAWLQLAGTAVCLGGVLLSLG